MASSNPTALPQVVKMKQYNGKIIQDCDLYIGRQCYHHPWKLAQSKWHNPFHLKHYNYCRKTVLQKYENYILRNKLLMNSLKELRGKRLGCWCKPLPCHGDILVKLVKKEIQKEIQNKNPTTSTLDQQKLEEADSQTCL
jgi:hypothetical protein